MILATFDENKNMYPAYVSKEGETILIKQNIGMVLIEKVITKSKNDFIYDVEIRIKNNSTQNSGRFSIGHLDVMKEDDSRFQKELRPQLYVDDSLEVFLDLGEIRYENSEDCSNLRILDANMITNKGQVVISQTRCELDRRVVYRPYLHEVKEFDMPQWQLHMPCDVT